MTFQIRNLVLLFFVLALLAPTALAQSIDLRLSDGSRWRGQVSDQVEVKFLQRGTEITMTGVIVEAGDLYIMVEGSRPGDRRTTIFKSDIRAIKTVQPQQQETPRRPATQTPREPGTTRPGNEQSATPKADARNDLGVFLLPLKGMVGVELRHQEIEAIGKEADKHGPGQIIVLKINSGGGLVLEGDHLARVMLDLKRRHRVVAWVEDAISMAAMLASFCDEIYFTTYGQMGAMTAGMLMADQSFEGAQLERWMRMTGDWMEAGGRSRYISEAMIHSPRMLSYDKDPRTGQVTFYNNLSGEFILSRAGQNLSFTASTAIHSGFADGIADSEEELAKLLDLPRWREINDVGRRLHSDWQTQVERARREVPLIFTRLNRGVMGGSPLDNINHQIQQVTQLITWWDRAPNVMQFEMGVPPKEELERALAELRKQAADLRRTGR